MAALAILACGLSLLMFGPDFGPLHHKNGVPMLGIGMCCVGLGLLTHPEMRLSPEDRLAEFLDAQPMIPWEKRPTRFGMRVLGAGLIVMRLIFVGGVTHNP